MKIIENNALLGYGNIYFDMMTSPRVCNMPSALQWEKIETVLHGPMWGTDNPRPFHLSKHITKTIPQV